MFLKYLNVFTFIFSIKTALLKFYKNTKRLI
jgi:hypothetical protein